MCAFLGCPLAMRVCVCAETIMAVAFEEEMNALKLVDGPDGKPQLVHEPYLQVSLSCRVGNHHTHATNWLRPSVWGKGRGVSAWGAGSREALHQRGWGQDGLHEGESRLVQHRGLGCQGEGRALVGQTTQEERHSRCPHQANQAAYPIARKPV